MNYLEAEMGPQSSWAYSIFCSSITYPHHSEAGIMGAQYESIW
jgi:hypothetical protein